MTDNAKGIIKVLVVDDSPVMCKALSSILNSDSQIIVAGVAYSGKEAVELVPRLKPDIITMDIHMPEMDGLEATRQIMAYYPTPILIVSTSVFKLGMEKVFEAISYGALEVLEKGKIGFEGDKNSAQEFIEKVKFLSNIKVIPHPLARPGKEKRAEKILEVSSRKVLDRIVAIAVSTGGPQMLQQILKRLPKEFPCAIVIVQHISEGFLDGLVEWLNGSCAIKVKAAQDREEIGPGVAYIAPCGFQMRVDEEKKIRLSDESSYDGHKPSGSVLLESVARSYKQGAIGVILSGMGADGAMGIKAIKEMGGETIAQNEETCVVFGMPKVAIEMGVVDEVLPVEKIPEAIAAKLRRQI